LTPPYCTIELSFANRILHLSTPFDYKSASLRPTPKCTAYSATNICYLYLSSYLSASEYHQ
jgi:hypothetical protein